ncbi:MAG: hypothetical protein A2233_01610 [Candidatus Kerfeldbacteria bacterium RIFOXYA2_FULL_38_24]|uniref:DNA-binding response regulator n=1 Tax=Candidatus Kerfeldbacteria bacterium RIFOXYB2_FULL_38_14 TaxID=1798547 RepID=A0A1G2BHD6_9BACT|nr:MAG: hypothetical protein A2319_04220 [Candidatus Kerfeldbacteria bacterium RIFOXYB2_FULL_38_14]OGY87815.1 MAG: hypothetical protein A2233_01610 [Candidatus Kerfeldbacteria bacterium RIFOXYA2_FULL_38_24]OGY89550.1 MAG: hypothetical protein A2458_00355 [Candidatus Kerfeldbacteria bacterium RIFOXYC2_FULL_38_9]
MKILIVEDEVGIGKPLQKSLERHGFAVDYAQTGKEALKLAHIYQYDCILLDINLPEIDGLTVVQQLREEANTTPIIMLTARTQLYNKLEGFGVGADDYITKPFHLEEVIARIHAVIKRTCANKNTSLQFGGYELFPEKNIVVSHAKNDKKIILTSKEAAILEYLIRNNDRIVSTEEIIEHVWDREVNSFTDSVKTHIKTLRQKIDPKKIIINTIRGKGYQIQL